MNRLLQVGDTFRLEPSVQLSATLKGRKADHTRVEVGRSMLVTVHWTETAPGGWTRECTKDVDLTWAGPSEAKWTVIHTELTGGTDPNDRDPFPDGHRVTATCQWKGILRTLRFYQTGCFCGLVKPPEVELVDSRRR
jgi:hypothetical protein